MNTVEVPQDQPVNEPLSEKPVIPHAEKVNKFSKTNPLLFTVVATVVMIVVIAGISVVSKSKGLIQLQQKSGSSQQPGVSGNLPGVNSSTSALNKKAPTPTPLPPTSNPAPVQPTTASSGSTSTSSQTTSQSGPATVPSSILVSATQGQTTSNAFSFTSKGATQFSINPYPISSLGTGIVLSPNSGGVSNGQTMNVSVQVGSTVPTGTYNGYVVYNFQPGNVSKNSPITITVQAPSSNSSSGSSGSSSSNSNSTASQNLRGFAVDKKNASINIDGLSVTVTDSTTGTAVGSYTGNSWSTPTLQPGHTYRVVANNVSGYSISNMVCYNCTSPSAYSYSGGNTFDIGSMPGGAYYGVYFKYSN